MPSVRNEEFHLLGFFASKKSWLVKPFLKFPFGHVKLIFCAKTQKNNQDKEFFKDSNRAPRKAKFTIFKSLVVLQ